MVLKLYGGQQAIAGNIIVRQRGTQYHPGTGVGIGKDHTIYALTDGVVTFKKKKNNRRFIYVLPTETGQTTTSTQPAKAKKEAVAVEVVPQVESGSVTTADDLKQLEGLGPAIEKKLLAAGITTFAQLAALTATDIEQLAEEHGISTAKFEKGNWVEQAKAKA